MSFSAFPRRVAVAGTGDRASSPSFSQTNALTYHNDNSRTGQNLTETALLPSTVNASTFGELFTVPVDGKVDAQPLYVSAIAIPGLGPRSVVYAATEHDSVYAFDARSGTVYWQSRCWSRERRLQMRGVAIR
jgi:outer membrane protein assembly factor BamB